MTTPQHDGRVTVRRASQADLLEVFRIEKAAFRQPWPFAAFERFVDDPGFLVAHAEDAPSSPVVGYVVADVVPNHGRAIGHVKDLAVHPDHRERGVGRRLLARALSAAAARGADSVKLEVRETNEAALSLYRRYGFETLRTVPRYYEDGEDALVMVRRLDGEFGALGESV